MKRVGLVVLIVVLLISVNVPGARALDRTQKIEPVEMVQPGRLLLEAGFAAESGRELRGPATEYDNIRVSPARVRWGYYTGMRYLPRVEFGAGIDYSANSRERSGGPDESGLEALHLSAKSRWNRYVGTSLSLSAFGSDDVFPHGNDGLDASLNVPARVPLPVGSLQFEAGYTLKGGDFENYFNYGAGYVLPGELVSPQNFRSFSLEFVGHETTVDNNGQDHLLALLGVNLRLGDSSQLGIWGGGGLDDGSPDFTAGLRLQYQP